MNLHTLPRTFYLTRHGQSDYNLLGKIGGDSSLTPAGLEYARRLADFARDHIGHHTVMDSVTGEERRVPRPARMWTSTLRRTKETAQFIEHTILHHTWDNGDTGDWVQFRPMARRNLDELYAGGIRPTSRRQIMLSIPARGVLHGCDIALGTIGAGNGTYT
jgi:6-phosphofructo-2-kinase / fructose-2,6-biphosphatase 2